MNKERPWLVWSAFFLFGVSSLFGWNSWITQDSFFRVRLQGSPYNDTFQSWVASTYFCFNLLSLASLLLIPASPRYKMVTGLFLSAAVFLLAAVMTIVAADLDSFVYFWLTLFLVVLSSVSSALIMSAYGIAAEYTHICAQAVTTGMV